MRPAVPKSDFGDRFDLVVDVDAAPIDFEEAIALFLLRVVERRQEQHSHGDGGETLYQIHHVTKETNQCQEED